MKKIKNNESSIKCKKLDNNDKKQKKLRAKEIRNTLIKEVKKQQKIVENERRIELRAKRENWYKLDNSALIYPAICSSSWNSVFRLSITMKDKINPDLLQKALDDNMKRYPFFNVSLRDGLFWHYFQSLTTKPIIEQEKDYPCRPFVFDKNKQIFRVLYYNNKISYETFHSLTDGGGAIQFFNTLIVRYCQLQGVAVENIQKYNLNALDLPNLEESEDAFDRYVDGGKSRPRKELKAYEIKGLVEPIEVLYAYTGKVKVAELKKISKSFGATINEFLSAIYIKVMLDEKKRENKDSKKPIKLSVPINLRKMLPTKSMRNFSQFYNMILPIDKENGDFKEILDVVKEQSKLINKEYVMGVINANVSSERNFFIRIMPLFLKDFFLKIVYSFIGENLFTSTISNLGVISLPPEISEKVESYNAMLGATKLNKINLTVVSFGDSTLMTFTTRLKDNRLCRAFFKMLSDFGLDIIVESNRGI